jgi:hypothetical protein
MEPLHTATPWSGTAALNEVFFGHRAATSHPPGDNGRCPVTIADRIIAELDRIPGLYIVIDIP